MSEDPWSTQTPPRVRPLQKPAALKNQKRPAQAPKLTYDVGISILGKSCLQDSTVS